MTDFLIYNLKAGFILSILYVLYALLLRKETYYSFNRTYLLGALVISFLLPALNISLAPSQSPAQNNFVYIEHAFQEVSQTLDKVEMQAVSNVKSFPIIALLILIGMIIATVRVGFQIVIIYLNIKKHELKKQGKYRYVLMDKYMTTHSFFNYIFVQKSDLSDRQRKNVLLHEQFHADRWHSFDLLLVGFLSILQWFNPFIYLLKRALTETHEFQADQAVVDRGVDKLRYQQLLLAQSRSIVFAGLTSKFNQSLIKNRLKMMNRINSKNSAVIKYLLVVPVVFAISIVFAVSQEKMDNTLQQILNFENGEMSFQYEEGSLTFEARDSLKVITDELILLYGGAKANSKNVSMEAERIIISKKKQMVYAFSEYNIPSISPVEEKHLKRLASGYGMRMHPILKVRRMHSGNDFSAPKGTPIIVTANGVVFNSGHDGAFGNFVIVDHGNEYSTKYYHLLDFIVEKGQHVKKGQIIGHVGNTGLSKAPHLHYEVWKDGKHVNPKGYLGNPK